MAVAMAMAMAALRAVLLALLLRSLPSAGSSADSACAVPPDDRFDCGPERLLARAGCEARGCCYVPAGPGDGGGPPWCFFPRGYRSYRADNVTATAGGYAARLRRVVPSFLPADVGTLRLDVALETESRLRFTVRPALPHPPPSAAPGPAEPLSPAAPRSGAAALRGARGHTPGEHPRGRPPVWGAAPPGPVRHRRVPAARRAGPVSAGPVSAEPGSCPVPCLGCTPRSSPQAQHQRRSAVLCGPVPADLHLSALPFHFWAGGAPDPSHPRHGLDQSHAVEPGHGTRGTDGAEG